MTDHDAHCPARQDDEDCACPGVHTKTAPVSAPSPAQPQREGRAVYVEASEVAPWPGETYSDLPPLTFDRDERGWMTWPEDADDFLVQGGTMQVVTVVCLKRQCSWDLDVEGYVSLNGILARCAEHRHAAHPVNAPPP